MKKIIALVLSLVLVLSMTACEKVDLGENVGVETTQEFVEKMGMGINLGNTFEAAGDWINGDEVSDYETAWGSPIITKEMIKGYADAGFGCIRVPVAWSNMMSEDYTIHPDYIERVKEVVGWIVEYDMIVILNIHWDGGWWEKFPTEYDECMKKYTRIWTQLCDAFGDFSDMVMFESLNEEGGWSSLWTEWSGTQEGKERSYEILNDINQEFVDIVRESGKNNETRHLLIAGYTTDIVKTCDELFEVPFDPEERLAVSVHYYTPPTFCVIDEDASWGKARSDWGSEKDYKELYSLLDKVKERFVDNGIPVVVGEFGCTTSNKTPEVVDLFLSEVTKAIAERDMCPVLWDTTGGFYDRYNCKINKPETLAKMLDAIKNR